MGTHLRRAQPLVLVFQSLHGRVPGVEILVTQEVVIDQVELSASVGERVPISFAREVHPPDQVRWLTEQHSVANSLWVAKLVTLKVKVCFASKGVDQQSN